MTCQHYRIAYLGIMKLTRKYLSVCMLLMACAYLSTAQSIARYSVSRNVPVPFSSIAATGNSVASWRNNTSMDDNMSNNIPIGFTFYYMGMPYTNVRVSTNGFLTFNTTGTATGGGTGAYGYDNTLFTSSTGTLLTLAPIFDDFVVPSAGSLAANIKYLSAGSSPSRTFTVEWISLETYNNPGPDLNFQVMLYEADGHIEFRYGTMYNGGVAYSYSCGMNAGTMQSPPLPSQLLSLQNNVAFPFNNTVRNNHDTLPVSNTSYVFSGQPASPSRPYDISFSNVTSRSIDMQWKDSSVTETYFTVSRSTDSINYTFVNSVTSSSIASRGTVYAFSDTGLLAGTTYYYRIAAANENMAPSAGLNGKQQTGTGTLSGTKSIGPTGNYPSITAAIAAMQSSGLAGPVILELQPAYVCSVETFPIRFSGIATSASTGIMLRPAAGATNLVITSLHPVMTMQLDGIKYLTIDGRPGGAGTNKELTIRNDTLAGVTLLFQNDAAYDTVQYCNVRGQTSNPYSGMVVIGTTTGPAGNHHLSIHHCDIREATYMPVNTVMASGTIGYENSYISITDNNIFNFSSMGVVIGAGGNGNKFDISRNSIYFTGTSSSLDQFGINFIAGNTSNDNLISGNYIGGTAPQCGGTAWTNNSGITFTGIAIGCGTLVATNVQNNTIQNIYLSNTSNTKFNGIHLNTVNGDNLVNVSGNVVGHLTLANSIVNNGTSTIGIQSQAVSSATISQNTVANLSAPANNNTVVLRGIQHTGTGVAFINNNIIQALTTGSSNPSMTNAQTALAGITYISASSGGRISGNSISNLQASYTSFSIAAVGIGCNGASALSITKNKIWNIRNLSTYASTSAPPVACAIMLRSMASGSDHEISNNMISLGNAQNSNTLFCGIWTNFTNNYSMRCYYNSVAITGTAASGAAINTYAFLRGDNSGSSVTNAVTLVNNIFYNERSGGSGKHYAIGNQGPGAATGWNNANYNLFSSASSSKTGLWNSTDANFAQWKTLSAADRFSYADSNAVIPSGAFFTNLVTGDLSINTSSIYGWAANGKGIAIAGIADDISGNARSAAAGIPADIGAHEFTPVGGAATPPNMTLSGSIVSNGTSTLSQYGRTLATITWGASGNLPSSLTAKYYSGVQAPDALNRTRISSYIQIDATGSTPYNYSIMYNYTPAETGSIAETSLRAAKGNSTGTAWTHFPSTLPDTAAKSVVVNAQSSFGLFTLTDPNNNPLPVTWLRFTAASTGQQEAKLRWSTAEELGNAAFIIERSEDGNSFEPVGTVKGNNYTQQVQEYVYNDKLTRFHSVLFYRVRQTDADGSSSCSRTVAVTFTRTASMLSFYPNPCTNMIHLSVQEPVSWQISDEQGKVWLNGTAHSNLDVPLDLLPKGCYLLHAQASTGPVTYKLLKTE